MDVTVGRSGAGVVVGGCDGGEDPGPTVDDGRVDSRGGLFDARAVVVDASAWSATVVVAAAFVREVPHPEPIRAIPTATIAMRCVKEGLVGCATVLSAPTSRDTPRHRRIPHRAVIAAVAVACGAAAACGGSGSAPSSVRPVTPAPPAPATPAATALPAPIEATLGATAPAPITTTAAAGIRTSGAPTGPPPFMSGVGSVTAGQLGATWHPGCPVAPSALRLLRLSYWGFDGAAHAGELVVNASVATTVIGIFSSLYTSRFPIREMVPASVFGGDDNAAAAADDTSGFNCRTAVAAGPPQWSVHAYGEAIDVNDVENPYVEGGALIPPSGAAYRDRADVRPGMAVTGGTLVEVFARAGWYWGGRWAATPDYQHFSSNGG